MHPPFAPVIRSEDGVAVPTVMMLLVAATALGMVSVMGSISSPARQRPRPPTPSGALAAADAGVDRALWRQNKMPPGPALLRRQRDRQQPAGARLHGPGRRRHLELPGQRARRRRLRSRSSPPAGRDGVNRKVSLLSRLNTGADVFGGERVIAKDWIDMNSNARITSRGHKRRLHLDSNAEICGDIRHGVGEHVTFESNSRPVRGLPGLPGIASCRLSSSRASLTRPTTTTIASSARTSAPARTATSPGTRRPACSRLNNNATLTMGGGDYLICRL